MVTLYMILAWEGGWVKVYRQGMGNMELTHLGGPIALVLHITTFLCVKYRSNPCIATVMFGKVKFVCVIIPVQFTLQLFTNETYIKAILFKVI